VSEWSAAALVLLGHGSTLNEESAAPVYYHAAGLRRRKLFEQVHEAFWKQDPQVKLVLATVKAPRVLLVPLFISEGYFTDKVIPAELGFSGREENGAQRIRTPEGQTLVYCRPVGTHPRMTEVVLARALGVVSEFPFPRAPVPQDTTLLLAGHGTPRDENSREAVERQAEQVRASGQYAAVHAMFLEEPPQISQWHELVQTRNVVVVPFFISEGMHTQEDIPMLLGETERAVRERLARRQPSWRNPTEKKGKLIWYSSSVGSHSLVTEIILERVREAMRET
jgi:sirohydrochlorin cobaltochelatase